MTKFVCDDVDARVGLDKKMVYDAIREVSGLETFNIKQSARVDETLEVFGTLYATNPESIIRRMKYLFIYII